jgi:hypothetical protein
LTMVNLGLLLFSEDWRVDFNLGPGYFKPWATRTPVLLLLLIGLAELACHVIPEHDGWGPHINVTNKQNEVPPGKWISTHHSWRSSIFECTLYISVAEHLVKRHW